MHRPFGFASTPLAVALLALSMGAITQGVQAQGAGRQASEEFAPGRILVMPRPGLPDAALDRILKAEGGKSRRLGNSRLYVVDVPKGSERGIANKLAHNPHFKFAELDYRVAPSWVPNDPYLGSAWHLSKIGATQAWDVGTGRGVTIAILDSGVDASHPDLAARLVGGWNFFDNNNNTADVYGHGTQVAGGAAATLNNAVGVASISGDTMIMPIRVTDTTGAGYSSMIANGIIYAADRGVRIANVSFANQPSRSAVVSAGQYMKDKGGLVFVAAGNSGIAEPFTPTTSLVPVSATDGSDVKASWSSYGSYVALSAPGTGIYTTTRGGGYTAASGTSIATPVAAGVAALALSVKPSLTVAQLESLLFSTAVDLGAPGRDDLYGYGRVNAAAAVAKAASYTTAADTQAPVASITAPLGSSSVSGLTTVDVSATDNVGVTKVELRVNNALIASDSSAPFGFSWDTSSVANGSATLVATAYDAAGNTKASQPVTVNVANATSAPVQADTTPPTVAIRNPMQGAVVSGNVTVSVSASDNAGAAGLRQTLSINGKQVASATGGSLSYNWNTRKAAAGSHVVQAVVRDAAGNTTTTSVTVRR